MRVNFKYKIGEKQEKLTILSEPFKKDPKSKRYFVKLLCDCGKEFIRCTRNFKEAKECASCRCKKNIQKIISKQTIKEIPIGSKYGHLTVAGKCFKYKGSRKLPVVCDCGLKYELFKKEWGKTKSCHKCREGYKHNNLYNAQEQTKKCTICNKIKPLSLFSIEQKTKTGRKSSCKECASFKQKASKFGLSKSELYKLLDKQNNRCLICKMEFKHYSEWCIDHCHHSGKIRGILCSNCNGGLRFFYDNIDFLNNAIEYLSRNY